MKLIQDLGLKEYGNQNLKKRYGLYECPVCKKSFEAISCNVKRKKTTKCKSCASSFNARTHGLCKHDIYSNWHNMRNRCLNKSHKSYIMYTSKGITICERWMKFENFIEDMYPSYKKGLTLDRINNDGNYEPSNCRWATRAVQTRNTRIIFAHNSSGYRGCSNNKINSKCTAHISINNKTVHVGTFNTIQEAAYAYDKYVIENNLEHTTNGLYKKETK